MNKEILKENNKELLNKDTEKEDKIAHHLPELEAEVKKKTQDPKKFLFVSLYSLIADIAWWIRQGIGRALMEQGGEVKIPVHMQERIRRYYLFKDNLAEKLGRPPSCEEIAEGMAVPLEKISRIEGLLRFPCSIFTYEGFEALPWEHISTAEEATAEKEALRSSDIFQVRQSLLCLSEKEREILQRRFGLACVRPESLGEIGASFGVSRERIRQLEERALGKLRKKFKREEKFFAYGRERQDSSFYCRAFEY